MTLLINRLFHLNVHFFKSIEVMGSSSVFTHCVLNYAISMNNLPCSIKMSGNMGMIYDQKDTGDDLKGQCKANKKFMH